jgi:hypothetical protein
LDEMAELIGVDDGRNAPPSTDEGLPDPDDEREVGRRR